MEFAMRYIVMFVILAIVLLAFFIGILPRITEQESQSGELINKTLEKFLDSTGVKFKYEGFFKVIGDASV